jgi:hypothetical protein
MTPNRLPAGSFEVSARLGFDEMRWLALPAGIVLLYVTLLDAFRTMVMPRASRGRFRLTRVLFLAVWRPWFWLGVRQKTAARRERVLSPAAPFTLFILLAVWAGLAVMSYALILWSPPFVHGVRGGRGFGDVLYISGTSFSTIGFSGHFEAVGWARAIVVFAAATGLGLVAVVIAYLPVLYQSFNRREVGIMMLDARAGSPPSGPELLIRAKSRGAHTDLERLFREWERWASDVLETHLSYPLLAFFRSPHDNTSWVTAIGAVLDAATLYVSAIDHPSDAAELFYATGTHAVEDLFRYFRLEERTAMIEREEFDGVIDKLAGLGVRLKDRELAWDRFSELRAAYGGRLDALAVRVAATPAQWIGDRSVLPLGASRH